MRIARPETDMILFERLAGLFDAEGEENISSSASVLSVSRIEEQHPSYHQD
jgi:hypothetical protein